MTLRRSLALASGATAGALSRRLRLGGGTALPGLVAGTVAPDLMAHLAGQIPQGVVLVTGTNGKTTTSLMVSEILRAGGFEPLQNHTGSNLIRGITTALMSRARRDGKLRVSESSIGVFEVDEAVLPLAIPRTRPRAVIVNNLFRDQLDRYGEVDTIRSLWQDAVASLPADTVLILNADDPAVAGLAGSARCPQFFFGMDDDHAGSARPEHAADFLSCTRCGSPHEYSLSFYAHIGHYFCPNCGAGRPQPQVTARQVDLAGFDYASFELDSPQGRVPISLRVGGLYNVYNALAAASAALALGIPLGAAADALQAFTPAFGRLERLEIDGRQVCLVLVKNPTGFNQVLRSLRQGRPPDTVLMVLNDRIADGQDVSWIWDVDFEELQGLRPLVSGIRAEELALRLKYAGLDITPEAVCKNLAEALQMALEATPAGGSLYVLPTYTAMLELERLLAGQGRLRNYWEKS